MLDTLFDPERPAHFSSLAGVTNARFAQYTEAAHAVYRQVMRLFEHHGLEYYLFAGSMVGYVRDRRMPPWMDDLDVIVFEDQVPLFEERVVPQLRRAGFNAFAPTKYAGGGYHILSMQMSAKRSGTIRYARDLEVTVPWAQVDAFYTTVDAQGLLRNPAAWGLYHVKDVPVDWVRPGQTVDIEGVDFRVFADWARDIRREYGDVMNNLVVASHGKTLLRVPDVPWAQVSAEFRRLYREAPNPLPPSVDAARLRAYAPIRGRVHQPAPADSFDEMLANVLNEGASDLLLSRPEQMAWALDFHRLVPSLRLHAQVDGAAHASLATHMRDCFTSLEGTTPEARQAVAEQIEALSPTQAASASARFRPAPGTRFIAWGQDVSWDQSVEQPPQNCLATVDFAYECGFDGVEVDVQLSRDGVLVLMNDYTLDKTATVGGPVAEHTAAQLGQIALKGGFRGQTQYVERFEEALRRNGSRGEVMCDLRRVNERTLDALDDALRSSGFMAERLLILAYDRAGGLQLKQRFPRCHVMLKATQVSATPDLAAMVAEAQGMDSLLVNAANNLPLVEALRQRTRQAGLGLGVYLHHRGLSRTSLGKMVEWGVDHITTQNHRYFDEFRA